MIKLKTKFIVSPELDYKGLKLIYKEIDEKHPLYQQFNSSIKEVLSDPNIDNPQVLSDIQNYYLKKAENINSLKTEVEEKWESIKEVFLEKAQEIFNNKNFNFEQFWIIYPSCIGVELQNTKEKAISFPITDNLDEAIYVIIHELLHVLFFNYIDQLYRRDFEKLTDKQKWDMSEVFNSIVLDREEFAILYPNYNQIPYPEHRELVIKMKKFLREEKFDFDKFFDEFKNL